MMTIEELREFVSLLVALASYHRRFLEETDGYVNGNDRRPWLESENFAEGCTYPIIFSNHAFIVLDKNYEPSSAATTSTPATQGNAILLYELFDLSLEILLCPQCAVRSFFRLPACSQAVRKLAPQ